MSRLADYFVLVGYDHEKDRGGQSVGKIIQRFPEKEWDDCPFTQGIELFCQPSGWKLSPQRCPPEFFIAVLTDMDADRHYCACLSFSESVSITLPRPDDDGDPDETENAITPQSLMFSPKCLVLVSRLDYFETFRNCLGIIYTAYVDRLDAQLEVLVGNIIGSVYVPPPGGPQIRFSIGAGDRQALQPKLNSGLPSSRNCVALLFQQLGIQNTLVLFCAALTDHKILFHSQSFSRLTDSCQAIVVLHYPLRFSYVYIPILPAHLVEVLSSPTPFMAGIHSSLADETDEFLDVIIVDLDGGSIKIPECVNIPMIPEPILSRTKKSLHLVSANDNCIPETEILNMDLFNSDKAFPPSPPKKQISSDMKDKEIRAVFIRLFAELLTGYRTCLTVIRIHPEPFITFHKANFLCHRGFIEDDFLVRVLDCMAFGGFVQERGPPYRVCDIFDEIYANIQDLLTEERSDPNKMLENIKDLAKQLYNNEYPNPQPYVQKVPKPTEEAYKRIHQPQFPYLDWLHVQEVIDEGIAKNNLKSKFSNMRPHQLRIVPIGPPSATLTERQRMVDNNARRLEVLRNCVNFIFENKISDGRIIFPAVLRALKSRVARIALTQELSYHIRSNRAMLEHQQFDLVVKLLNCALQNDSSMDENGVAAAILPLATSFCRKLCTGVIQFAYTCVQEHAVWATLQFWEAAFYQDVQKQIRQLYAPHYEEAKDGAYSPTSNPNELGIVWNKTQTTTPDTKRRSGIRPREIGALEIAAEQLRIWPSLTKEKKEEMINNEESTVYSQAIHYANRMVYMRVPLDTKTNLKTYTDWESNSNSNITASIAESDSVDAESGFDETEISDVGAGVIKFVTRFVEKVCNDSKVTQDHIKALHTMVPGVVAMHVETLEAVHRESKRLPPIQKPKILKPTLLQGEEVVMDGLRVYLLPDGREEGTGGNLGGPALLPAEGAVFLTNYRIIFKGIPCDPVACEQVVVRYFPVSTMTKEKQIKLGYTPHIDQLPKDGIQIRANIFQLMRLAFDEEVIPEDVDTFRKLANKYRNPASVFQAFAFTGQVIMQPTMVKHKEKNASLKNFAKKTLMKTARKAGIKPKQSARKQKYVLQPPPSMQRRSMSPRSSSAGSDSDSERPNSEMFDDLSIVDESEYASSWTTDPKTIEKLLQRPGYHDYERLGLNSLSSSHHGQEPKSEQFRISTVNANFAVCRSYPALIVVPLSVTDDSIKKLARTHRQYRFPVITWRHPRTKALLIRASGFHSRGLMGMLKHDTTSGTAGSETSSSIEQERYFSNLVSATPNSERYRGSCSDSLTSLDSLMMAGINVPETPDMNRRALKTGSLQRVTKPKSQSSSRDSLDSIDEVQLRSSPRGSTMLTRAANAFRASGSWRSSTFGRIGSIKEKTRTTVDPSRLSVSSGMSINQGDIINSSVQGFKRVSLYVLGEKAQMKGIKMESFPKCDFIPVDFYEVRHVKASFKKLSRACVPSNTPSADATFYKTVEESEWLLQVQNIMQLAGATVDLLDVQGSSVMICLEDGWDITTQVVSAAQILLDPFYRTIEGFKCLVEKEWLSFGHRFTHRSNQTAANQASGFAPLFLQFLDVVHQIHNQFPLSFEFNQFFLKFLAYHYVSNRFRTFMMDNEYERFECGWILDEKKASKFDDPDEDGFVYKHQHQSNPGMSVWDYIEKHHRRSTVFCNFMYSLHDQEMVLRPYSNLANMKIWDYYIDEDLAHGPPYEIETVQKELALNEDVTIEGNASSSRVVNICFDNVQIQEPESFKVLLQEVHRVQTDLGHLQQKWRIIWDKLEGPSRDSKRQDVSLSVLRSHGRSIHKRSTLEILVKGKMLGEAAKRFGQPHRFEKFTYTTPAFCDYCSQVLWGFLKTGMHCGDCGYNCHEKCMSHVPKNCTKLKIVAESSNSSSNVSRAGGSESSSGSGGMSIATLTGAHPSYENFTPTNSNTEHRTLEGYLYKKGALLKGWKQRWFVLDSTKHQMRYYDYKDDPTCKGYIDLFDVQAVHPIKNVQGPLKKSDENAAFELKTSKRMYHFYASDAKTAQDWIDKIHSFI
ncbi:myotubularin-related protein 13-like isoform X4 [Mytilus californianus]|uniref:myotubularin-related protein 13-like isoform X4 n=1 Tax=Mytilus californianus TaxID=6549 RepID=UPI002245ADE5|nr:myotubularin-related protein 13-like isoform X4 [Mytilus californianus]